jgi:type II secretory pathway component PulM
MNAPLGQLRAFVDGLAPRERLLLLVVAVLILALVFWVGVVTQVMAGMRRAEARAATAESDLQTALRLRRELDQIRAPLSEVERRIEEERASNLFTTLEALARQSAIQVDSMEPQASPSGDRYKETKVQVVLKSVTLAQVANYLHRIESAPQLLSIKSLRMRTLATKADSLDVTFTVSSFETL